MSTYIAREEVFRIFNHLEHQIKQTKELLIAVSDDSSLADLKLSEATTQDIQLELIRRTQFNLFDGRDVVNDLVEHQALWRAVMMTRTGDLELGGLISLRDLPGNVWNTDTLCILANDEHAAHKLAEFGERWQADNVVIHNMETTSRALSVSHVAGPLVTMWWD
jgi:hypothetical protein